MQRPSSVVLEELVEDEVTEYMTEERSNTRMEGADVATGAGTGNEGSKWGVGTKVGGSHACNGGDGAVQQKVAEKVAARDDKRNILSKGKEVVGSDSYNTRKEGEWAWEDDDWVTVCNFKDGSALESEKEALLSENNLGGSANKGARGDSELIDLNMGHVRSQEKDGLERTGPMREPKGIMITERMEMDMGQKKRARMEEMGETEKGQTYERKRRAIILGSDLGGLEEQQVKDGESTDDTAGAAWQACLEK